MRSLIGIALGLPALLAVVELDRQSGFQTEEIGDVRADWLLAAELDAVELAAAQSCP